MLLSIKTRNNPVAFSTKFPMISCSTDLEILYKKNVVVFRCVSMIARSVSAVPLFLRNSNGEIDESFNYILSYPNTDQCFESFFEELVTVFLLFGSVYCYKSGHGKLMSLKVVKPNDIEHVYNNGRFDHYLYHTQDGTVKIYKDFDGACDLMHIRGNYFENSSQYDVITQSAVLYNQVNQQLLALLKKGCRPSGILYIHQDDRFDSEQYGVMMSELKKWLSGDCESDAFVLSTKYEWKELGLRPSETNLIEKKDSAAKEICQAFAVPYILLSQQEATYSNYKEARKHFYEDTVVPLIKRICSDFSFWLFKKHGLTLSFSTHMIQALEIANEIQTVNEQRRMHGYEPIPQGDTLLRDVK